MQGNVTVSLPGEDGRDQELQVENSSLAGLRDPILDDLLTERVPVVAITRGRGQVAAFLIPNNAEGRQALSWYLSMGNMPELEGPCESD